MKNASVFLALLLAGSGLLHAMDWGLNLNELPLVMTGQKSLGYSSSQARLWFSSPVSGMDFRIETVGTLSASTTDLYTTNRNYVSSITLDVSELRLGGVTAGDDQGGVIEWNLGRRTVTDLTGGWIVDSRWDGAAATAQLGQTKLGMAVGYSGLLLNATGRVAGSPADLTDQANTSLLWGPARLFGSLWVGYNEALWRQDLQTEFLADWDFRSGSQAVHGAYVTTAFAGPLPGGLRERVYATGSLRVAPGSSTPGFLTGTELSTNFSFLGSRVVLGAVGGWGWGNYGFQPLSGDGLAEIVSLPSAHAASIKLDYSIRPISRVLVGLKANSLWRTSTDVPLLSGFKQNSSDYWVGTEGGFYGSWNPTSDFSFGWSGGIFFPQYGAFDSTTQITGLAAVTVTLKL